MKILIITDAWIPQVNGVVRTLQATQCELEKSGHTVQVIGPDLSRWTAFAVPTYTEIVLELFPLRRLLRAIAAFAPDSLHIATEGPLGWAARRLCLLNGWAFTTAYHSRFPEFIGARVPRILSGLAQRLAYAVLRRFHAPSAAVMVPTSSMVADLDANGFTNLVLWSRGVDTGVFTLRGKFFEPYATLKRPILLYVGRISVEKNIESFLTLFTNGTKVVVGSGPDLERLRAACPEACFLGHLQGEQLAQAYAAADVFVFPSKSDTFGLVLLEACACGLRIAAYPVSGPKDIFAGEEASGFVALDADLQKAVDRALTLSESPLAPHQFAQNHSWEASTRQFFAILCPMHPKMHKNEARS